MRNNYNGEYAGFGIRVVASVIDSILLILIMIGVVMVASLFITDIENITAGDEMIFNMFMLIIPTFYYILFWFFFQATPAKMFFRLKIVDAKTGDKPTLLQCFLRLVGYYISSALFCLGFLWVIFDGRKQGWHDKIASTVVIKE